MALRHAKARAPASASPRGPRGEKASFRGVSPWSRRPLVRLGALRGRAAAESGGEASFRGEEAAGDRGEKASFRSEKAAGDRGEEASFRNRGENPARHNRRARRALRVRSAGGCEACEGLAPVRMAVRCRLLMYGPKRLRKCVHFYLGVGRKSWHVWCMAVRCRLLMYGPKKLQKCLHFYLGVGRKSWHVWCMAVRCRLLMYGPTKLHKCLLALLFGCWEEVLARVVRGGALLAVNVRTQEATHTHTHTHTHGGALLAVHGLHARGKTDGRARSGAWCARLGACNTRRI